MSSDEASIVEALRATSGKASTAELARALAWPVGRAFVAALRLRDRQVITCDVQGPALAERGASGAVWSIRQWN